MLGMRAAPLILLVAACYRSPVDATTLANKSDAKEPPGLTMTAHGMGPIDASTKATLMDLRTALVGYEVKPVIDGSLQYDIFRQGERLAYVVPDDNTGLVFNIHAISSRVEIKGHPWRVGRAFHDASHLTECECWGPNPTCFAAGEHIAVNFDRDCEGLVGAERQELKRLEGITIQRVIWSPSPFGEAYGEDRD